MGIPLRGPSLPPPAYFAAAFLLGIALDRWLHLPLNLPLWLAYPAWLLLVLSALLAGSAFATLLTARTTFRHDRPPAAFVATGPFRFTRNPMYLSLGLLHLGLALLLRFHWPVLLLPLALWLVHVRDIPREEEQLKQLFGDRYSLYCRQVRRWL